MATTHSTLPPHLQLIALRFLQTRQPLLLTNSAETINDSTSITFYIIKGLASMTYSVFRVAVTHVTIPVLAIVLPISIFAASYVMTPTAWVLRTYRPIICDMCEVIFFVAWDTFRVTAALSILATSCVALVTFVVVQTVYRFVKPWIIYVFDLINNMTTSHPDPVTFEDAMPKSFEDSNDEYRRNPNDRFPESVSPAKHQNTQPQTYFKDNEDPATDTYTSDKNEYMDGELTSDARQPSNGHLQLNAIPPSSPSESHLPHIHHELPDIWTSDDTLFTPDERAQNGMETNKCIEQGGFVDAVRGFFDGFASFFSKKQ